MVASKYVLGYGGQQFDDDDVLVAKGEAIKNAARTLAAGRARLQGMSPRAAAVAAHYAGGPSVAALEKRIRSARGLTA